MSRELACIMLAQELMMSTKKPTKNVQDCIFKIKTKMTSIYRNQREFYDEADKLKDKAYKEAWIATAEDDEMEKTRYVSIGTTVMLLLDVVNPRYLHRFAGKRVIERAIESYLGAKSYAEKEYEMEFEADKLAIEFIKRVGFEPRKRFKLKG